MESQRTPREQLDTLDQDRSQLRARLLLPWWQHVGLGLIWFVLTAGHVLLSDSYWIFAIQGGVVMAVFILWHSSARTLGARLDPSPQPRWAAVLYVVGGAVFGAPLIFLSETFASRVPAVIGCVATALVVVLVSIRQDRRHPLTLRDER